MNVSFEKLDINEIEKNYGENKRQCFIITTQKQIYTADISVREKYFRKEYFFIESVSGGMIPLESVAMINFNDIKAQELTDINVCPL